MQSRGRKVDRIAGSKGVGFFADADLEFSAHDKEKLVADVMMEAVLVGISDDLAQKNFERRLRNSKIQRLEGENLVAAAKFFRQTNALVAADHDRRPVAPLFGEEMLKSHVEHRGEAKQGRKSRNQFAGFQFRNQRRGESRVFLDIDKTHALPAS